MTIETNLRNATLQDLADLLESQRATKRDVVVPAAQIVAEDGNLRVPGMIDVLDEEGVTVADATLTPTAVCDETIAAKLGVPLKYLRTVREQGLMIPNAATVHPPGVWEHDGLLATGVAGSVGVNLLDGMLNAHLAAHGKNVLVRAFTDDDAATGVARAVLSDSYFPIDNLDCLYSVLDGVRQTGVDVTVDRVDLSERAMRVFFVAPSVQALAPVLLRGYRSPFGSGGIERVRGLADREGLGYGGGDEPVVFAGFVAKNSETGNGRWSIAPRLVIQICKNGMTITRDEIARTHLGGTLEEGIVQWSHETQRTAMELVKRKTADAVRTFLDVDYMTRVLSDIEGQAGADVPRPEDTIRVVAQRLRYTDNERQDLLSHFVAGGQLSAGGIMNAVTSLAQTVEDPDRAAEIEASAFDALTIAARG